jgi:hypothetical protein
MSLPTAYTPRGSAKKLTTKRTRAAVLRPGTNAGAAQSSGKLQQRGTAGRTAAMQQIDVLRAQFLEVSAKNVALAKSRQNCMHLLSNAKQLNVGDNKHFVTVIAGRSPEKRSTAIAQSTQATQTTTAAELEPFAVRLEVRSAPAPSPHKSDVSTQTLAAQLLSPSTCCGDKEYLATPLQLLELDTLTGDVEHTPDAPPGAVDLHDAIEQVDTPAGFRQPNRRSRSVGYVSLAEPSLKVKLRQGDSLFSRSNDATVTPTCESNTPSRLHSNMQSRIQTNTPSRRSRRASGANRLVLKEPSLGSKLRKGDARFDVRAALQRRD